MCGRCTARSWSLTSKGRKKDLQAAVQAAEQKFKEAERVAQEAEKKASDEADKKGVEVDDNAYLERNAGHGASQERTRSGDSSPSQTSRPGLGRASISSVRT